MRKVLGIAGILAIAGGVLFAQGSRMPGDGSAQDALLAEIRALRADIHQATSAGIRTQLLVARLQLQEQRILTVARQLADVQSALTSVRTEIAGERARALQLKDAASRATGQGRLALQQAILESGAQIDQQQKQERQLQDQETELLRAVSDAHARWANFNDRLDEVERSLQRVN